ncbi:MAG TPA: SEC-C metal-binding domain-containing protein [Gaiellaceae bacterium]|jgi:sulfatase maturation enzyme AslB (radical SAM superfamily)|nr:SEC-C metal-binding domain-containing protein [Gaiellaceae bacterium]
MTAAATEAPRSFHLLAKPTGAVCNLDCPYCFFLSKEMLYPGSRFRMADDLLETYVRQLIEGHGDAPEHGLNVLCAGYKMFFHHVDRPMKLMSMRLAEGRAPSEIVRLYAVADAGRGRNDPCTCGNGRKWKHCHGAPSPRLAE